MATKINLVQGDNRPFIRIALLDKDGAELDVGDPNITVTAHFRATGADELLASLPCEKLGGNLVRHNFPDGTLDVEPGSYEEEIEVNFGGEKHTVYERIKFNVRGQFD